MRRKQELVDFQITFPNRTSLKVHRVVLAAAIPFFRRMFTKEAEEVTLREIDSKTLESVVNLAYGGKIEITSKNVRLLLLAAKCLQMTRLQDACWEFLEKRLRPNNALEVRRLAEDLECAKFIDTVDYCIKENFEDFSNSESFLNFPFLALKEVVSKRDVKITTEEKMFDAVIRWVKASPLDRCSLLCELLSFVRLDEIKPSYLDEKVSKEELIRSSPQCKNLIKDAINHHLFLEENSEFYHSSCSEGPCKLFEEKSEIYPSSSNEGSYQLLDGKSELNHLSSSAGPCKTEHIKSTDGIDDHMMYVYYSSSSAESCERENVKTMDVTDDHRMYVCHSSSSAEPCETEHDKSVEVTDDHRVYAVCATSNEICVTVFDPECETWRNLSNYGKMHVSKVFTLSKIIYIFGANEIISFNISSHKWNTTSSVHSSVAFSGGVSYLNKIYFFGGRENISNIVRCFNPRLGKWEKTIRMSKFVQDPGVASLKESIYVTGGRYQDEIYNAAQRYNPKIKALTEVSPMLCKRYDHGCAYLKGKIYVCGGIFHAPLCSTEVYDPFTNEWNFVCSMKEPRFDLSVISSSGKIYVTERLRGSGGAHDITVYDQENDEWKSDLPSLSVSDNFDRVFLASTVFSERMICTDRHTKDKKDVHIESHTKDRKDTHKDRHREDKKDTNEVRCTKDKKDDVREDSNTKNKKDVPKDSHTKDRKDIPKVRHTKDKKDVRKS